MNLPLPLVSPINYGPMPAQLPHGIPPGSIMAFAGTPPADTTPETWGWMICDGRLLTPGEYPYLYAAIGTLYNQAGDAGTSFRLPDFRGYFLRMADMGRGIDPDTRIRKLTNGTGNAGVGSIQSYALQSHMHEYNSPLPPVPPPPPPPSIAQAGTDVVSINTQLTGAPTNSLSVPPGDEGNVNISAGETRPVNMYVLYIIRVW
jgi:microcystin-dependent protein